MNSTAGLVTAPDGTDGGVLSSPRMSSFGYGVGVSVGILLLITTITLASYFCTRANHHQQLQHQQRQQQLRLQRHLSGMPSPPPRGGDMDVVIGIDEATLASYPTVLYAQAKGKEGDYSGGCCPICLADYKDSDLLRLLPDCKHQFHTACVDPWLRMNPSCPVCRTSPLPSPMPTPLAEVVPLAANRR